MRSPRNLDNSYFDISPSALFITESSKKIVSVVFVSGISISKSCLIVANILLMSNKSLLTENVSLSFGVKSLIFL